MIIDGLARLARVYRVLEEGLVWTGILLSKPTAVWGEGCRFSLSKVCAPEEFLWAQLTARRGTGIEGRAS